MYSCALYYFAHHEVYYVRYNFWIALFSVALLMLWPVSLWVYSFMKRLMLMHSELKLRLLFPFHPV